MRRSVVIAAVIAAGAASVAAPVLLAQAPAAPQAPPVFGMDAQLKSQFGTIRQLLVKTADVMPAEAYAFRPVPEIRTFAAAVAHTASTNFGMCANLTGKPNPMAGVDLEKTVTAKAEAVKVLNDSFTFCNDFVGQLTSEKLAETYKATSVARDGQRGSLDVARGGLLSNLIAHNNEMYGYMAVYLRLKGLVPPSSDRGSRGRGGDDPRQP